MRISPLTECMEFPHSWGLNKELSLITKSGHSGLYVISPPGSWYDLLFIAKEAFVHCIPKIPAPGMAGV